MNMRLEDIKAYCLNKWKAYEAYPFGDIPICYKLNGKVFAQVYPNQEDFPDEELLNMIDHAYDTVFHSFSKKIQKQILTVDKMEIRPISAIKSQV